tara:strand:+ start:111 stop:767 length:657 start_codon:yes stop_codon:yes gene_type:complete
MKIIFLTIFILLLFIILTSFEENINIYDLMERSKPIYPEVKLGNLFKQTPDNMEGLEFGYICPGAIKTIAYLKKQDISDKLREKIKSLTDFLFFVEIYAIYSKYLDSNIYEKIDDILKNRSCKISNLITEELTNLFSMMPKKIKTNLPDDFYHIRHDTLICSNNELLVDKRIKLLKSIYENFDSHKCLGKRDGVSGCRDCCSDEYPENYGNCVDLCMN